MNLEFEMSVLSDLGGRWDVFFLPEVIAAGLNLEFEMPVLSDLGGRWDEFFLPEVIA